MVSGTDMQALKLIALFPNFPKGNVYLEKDIEQPQLYVT